MLSVSSRIWTRVAVSISYDDNRQWYILNVETGLYIPSDNLCMYIVYIINIFLNVHDIILPFILLC